MSTRVLPTGRNGQVYYGPKTLAQAADAIYDIRADYQVMIESGIPPAEAQRQTDSAERRLISSLRDAGYQMVAAKTAKRFAIE